MSVVSFRRSSKFNANVISIINNNNNNKINNENIMMQQQSSSSADTHDSGGGGGGVSNMEIYTIRSPLDESNGRDNLGHNIPELLSANGLIETSSTITALPEQQHPQFQQQQQQQQQQQLEHPQINTISINEMTPLPTVLKLGRRTSYGIDVLVLVLVAVWLILIELGIFPHVKRGFHCDDQTIAHKFTGDTIAASLIIATIFVPFFLLWIGEAILYKPKSIKSTRLKQTLYQTLRWFREYSIGMLMKLFIVDALKVLLGELRPHFLESCRPDTAINCTGNTFITEYKCTNIDDSIYFVRDSSKSFPSGHSSIGFFEATFLIWYLQCRFPRVRSKFLIPMLQSILILWALVSSVTRITDNRHHWWDVLAGAILGIVFAALTCIFLCKNFHRRNFLQTEVMISQNGNGERHTSVKRLLSNNSGKDEVTMNHIP